MDSQKTSDPSNRGTVISVRSSVVDVRFSERLPPLYNVLRAGGDENIIIEVINHLDSSTVRGIALTPTQGLALGSAVIDTGHFLKVPVGKGVLGRVFNVFGETIDKRDPLKGDEWRPIHQQISLWSCKFLVSTDGKTRKGSYKHSHLQERRWTAPLFCLGIWRQTIRKEQRFMNLFWNAAMNGSSY